MSKHQVHPLAATLAGRHAPDNIPPGGPVHIVPVETVPLERALRRAPTRSWQRFARIDRGALNQQRGRANGLLNDNAVYGWAPPLVSRQREACTACAPNYIAPVVLKELIGLAAVLDGHLHELEPEAWAKLHEVEIGPDWRFPGTGWTSCIVNDTAALPYHVDGGNTPGTWSAMAVIRRGVQGGHLHLPDLDITAPCENGTAIIFNGQEHLHGVTPFKRRFSRSRSYRYTVVFYQRSGMTQCGTPEEELQKARLGRTAREHAIADGHKLPLR